MMNYNDYSQHIHFDSGAKLLHVKATHVKLGLEKKLSLIVKESFSFLEKIMHLFSSREKVWKKIMVKDGEQLKPVYVKVNELATKLGISIAQATELNDGTHSANQDLLQTHLYSHLQTQLVQLVHMPVKEAELHVVKQQIGNELTDSYKKILEVDPHYGENLSDDDSIYNPNEDHSISSTEVASESMTDFNMEEDHSNLIDELLASQKQINKTNELGDLIKQHQLNLEKATAIDNELVKVHQLIGTPLERSMIKIQANPKFTSEIHKIFHEFRETKQWANLYEELSICCCKFIQKEKLETDDLYSFISRGFETLKTHDQALFKDLDQIFIKLNVEAEEVLNHFEKLENDSPANAAMLKQVNHKTKVVIAMKGLYELVKDEK